MAQNSDETAEPKKMIGRPFPKGVSGNPGGRPKGVVAMVRSLTNDGEELVNFMVRILRGEEKDARFSDRMRACEWLTDRGYGRNLTISDLEYHVFSSSELPINNTLSEIPQFEEFSNDEK